MGTPDFAVPVLEALLEAGHDLAGVYTRPDRPSGRGRRVVAPEVKRFAMDRGLLVLQPTSLRRDRDAHRRLSALCPDLIVVAAYGLFLPQQTLEVPRLGCLNVHPSLLPRHRGASPVATAILEGDAVTGVTIMQLDEGMDSGPVLAQIETPIGLHENAEDLTRRLFRLGAGLLIEVLPGWERGDIEGTAQDETRATFTHRLSRDDGEIDWNNSTDRIARQVRAYYPWPGSFTRWAGRLLKIIEARASGVEVATPPGSVVTLVGGGLGIGTGDGVLEPLQLQLEGRRPVTAREFALGHGDFPGARLG